MNILSYVNNFTYVWAVWQNVTFVGSINRAGVNASKARVEMRVVLDAAPDKREGVKGAICIIRPNTQHLDLSILINL